MAAITIQAKTAHVVLGPTGFVNYAKDFLNAFNSYKPEQPFSPAKNYLVCRSIELSLKSYLLLKKVPLKEVKYTYGHDLSKIVKKVDELGINMVVNISEEERTELLRANSWYNRKGFEYFDIQNIVESKQTLPNLDLMLGLAERLIDVLLPKCLSSSQQP
jgi:hypothetical protein